jgi:hypothetical protein
MLNCIPCLYNIIHYNVNISRATLEWFVNIIQSQSLYENNNLLSFFFLQKLILDVVDVVIKFDRRIILLQSTNISQYVIFCITANGVSNLIKGRKCDCSGIEVLKIVKRLLSNNGAVIYKYNYYHTINYYIFRKAVGILENYVQRIILKVAKSYQNTVILVFWYTIFYANLTNRKIFVYK